MANTEKQSRIGTNHASPAVRTVSQIDAASAWMLATWLQLIDGCEEAWEELDGLFGSFDPPIGGLLHQVASARESIALARALLDAIDSQQLIVADASEDRSLPTRIHARFGYHDPLSWLRKCCLRCIELSTDRRRVREAQEAELTRAIYNLAYGLSHEINNPLANISARAQLLLARAKSDDDRKTLATTIIDQSHRAHEMLAEVMLVVQPPLMVPKAFAVAEAIRASSANLSEKAKDKGIRLTFELPALPIRLYVDEQAIVEALSIGLRNAIEACQAVTPFESTQASIFERKEAKSDAASASQILALVYRPIKSNRRSTCSTADARQVEGSALVLQNSNDS